MDVSPEYVAMCDCPEIQGHRLEERHSDTGKWQEGDFWTTRFDVDKGKVFIVYKPNDAWADEPHYLHHPIECIWLPRQDQLQMMYSNGNFGLQTLCCFIYDFATSQYGSGFTINGSMEQLWLAFVMKSLYQKSWNGSGWV